MLLFVFVYLDDILIFSPDEESHIKHVRQVLQRLLDHRLYIKAETCEFHVSITCIVPWICGVT